MNQGIGVFTGKGFFVGDALAAGEAFITGEALAAGDNFGEGDAAATGCLIGTAAPATNCHTPLRLAKLSTKRYCPLISMDFPSGVLYLPFLRILRPDTKAASLLTTLTFRSATSIESALSAPLS